LRLANLAGLDQQRTEFAGGLLPIEAMDFL